MRKLLTFLIPLGAIVFAAYWPASAITRQQMEVLFKKKVVSGSYTGPGNVVSGATGWWGLRAYNAAYATGSNSGAIVCNATTFTTCQTVNISASGTFPCTSSASSSCSTACATTCVVKSLTDQTGNGNTMACGSAAACPTLTFNCYGTLPCLAFSGSQQLTMATNNSVTAPISMVVVTTRTGSFTSGLYAYANSGNPFLAFAGSANTAKWVPTGTAATGAANDSASHSLIGTENSGETAGEFYIDGGSGIASGGGAITTGAPMYLGGRGGSAELVGNITEAGYWAVQFSGTQVTNMCHNQYAYWSTSVSC